MVGGGHKSLTLTWQRCVGSHQPCSQEAKEARRLLPGAGGGKEKRERKNGRSGSPRTAKEVASLAFCGLLPPWGQAALGISLTHLCPPAVWQSFQPEKLFHRHPHMENINKSFLLENRSFCPNPPLQKPCRDRHTATSGPGDSNPSLSPRNTDALGQQPALQLQLRLRGAWGCTKSGPAPSWEGVRMPELLPCCDSSPWLPILPLQGGSVTQICPQGPFLLPGQQGRVAHTGLWC